MKSLFRVFAVANLVTFLSAVNCSQGLSPDPQYYHAPTTNQKPSYWQSSQPATYKQPDNVAVNIHTKVQPPIAQPVVIYTSPNNKNPEQVRVTVNHEEANHNQFTYDYQRKVYRDPIPIPASKPFEFVSSSAYFPEQKVHFTSQPRYTVDEVKQNYTRCYPKNVIDFTWDSSAYFNREVERFYMPITYKKAYNNFYKAATGSHLRVGSNLNDVCYIADIDWNDLSIIVWAYGKIEEHYQCRFLDELHSMECLPKSVYGEPFLFFGTKMDNKTYMVGTACWKHEEPDWFLISNKKSISYSLKQEVLSHVQTLGFHPSDYNEANYDKCPTESIYGSVHTADIILNHEHKHFHAKPLIPIRQFTQSHNYQPKPYYNLVQNYPKCIPPKNVHDLTWDSAPYFNKGVETFYIPLAYERSVENFHKTISGQFLRDVHDVNDVCLTIDVDWRDFSAVVSTFGGINTEKFNCHFPAENKFIFECISQDKSESFISFVTKSDDKTYFVAYQCYKEGQVDWSVYSNKKFVPFNLKNEILTHVQDLGFAKTEYSEPSYSNCARRSSYNPNPLVSSGYYQRLPVHSSSPQYVQAQNFQKPVPPVQHHYVKPTLESCQLPYNKRITWNTHEYRNQLTENFYMPMAHKEAFINYAKLATGQIFRTYDNVNGICLRSVIDNFDHSFQYFAYNNAQQSPVIKCGYERNNFWTWRCEEENGKYVQSSVIKSDDKSYFVVYNCHSNGPTWAVFYKHNSKLPEHLKQEILEHLQTLGFRSTDYKEITYDNCGYDSEVETEGAVGLLPKCNAQSPLQLKTWESTSNFDGVEYFEVAMADAKVPQLYNNILKRNFAYSYKESKSTCFRWRNNYHENVNNLIGYDDVVSYDYKIIHRPHYGWSTVSKPKEKGGIIFSDYVVKTDNVNWILATQCWETADNTWVVYVKPGTSLSQSTKNSILKTVQELGLNSRNYEEFNYDNCKFNNRLFVNAHNQKTCDCLH